MAEIPAGDKTHQAAPMPARAFPERYYPVAAVLSLLVFAIYVATLAPNLMPGDTGDMVQAAATLREAHPPGYPLYALIGKLFVALPIGDIPYRANLMAAFLGGLAVGFAFLAVLLLTRHVVASLAAALLFAFNYLFWTYFTLAETFCLNNFFLAYTAFLALLWRERHREQAGCPAARRVLTLLAFVAGLSLGNHHTMVLTFPGLFLFAAAVDRSVLRPRRLAALLGWFALGLVLPYLYLVVAAMLHPLHHWEDASTPKGLLKLFLRKKYGTFQLAPGEGAAVTPADQAVSYFSALLTQYLWPGFFIGLMGLVAKAYRDRAALLYTGGGFLLGVAFILHANIDPKPTAYDAATLERFYQLPNFFFVLWVGYGLGLLARSVEGLGSGSVPRLRARLVAACLLVMPGTLAALNYSKANLRDNYLYPRFIYNIIDTLPPNAILLTWSDTVGMGADYLLDAEQRRPDVAHVLMGLVGTEPYRTTLRLKYPHLYWPGTQKERSFVLGRFLEENLRKHRIFIDGLPIKISFPLVRHGLIYEIRPRGDVPKVKEVMANNEALWKRYDLRQVDTTLYPANSMCYSVVVFYYLFQRFSLGAEYNHFGQYEDALRHFNACVPMDPFGYVARSPAWHRQVARAYVGLKKSEQGIAHLKQALAAAPEEPETYALLAAAYQQLGDKAQSERYAKEHRQRQKAWEEKQQTDQAPAP